MKDKPQNAETVSWIRGVLFQGWVGVAVWMVVGLLLEGLIGFKTPAYLQDDVRRELFRLGHAHGTLLNVVLVVATLCADRFRLSPPSPAVQALRIGTVLMPVGFVAAGVWHYESDPGFAIWLVPISAVLVIFGIVAFALSARARAPEP